jgi:selenocysteine lyase/cysteine desulfurase
VTRDALIRDFELWTTGAASASGYTEAVANARVHAAALLGAETSQVATGSQISVFAALAAAAAPRGAEVVCIDGDFSSIVAPFLIRGDLKVRHVPVDALADAVTRDTWMVSYSLVQSATGEVADAASVAAAARDVGARVLVDTTQATGWMPTTDLEADLIVCHSYKWLSAPRGAAFAAFSGRAMEELKPIDAGWWSGTDPWASCYGPDLYLADDASRFDVSPAWHAWIGAEAALGFAASLDAREVQTHDVGLANAFRERLGLEASDSAIVTWPDAEGDDFAALTAAGIKASARAGRARVAFHLWNDEEDVDLAARAIGR